MERKLKVVIVDDERPARSLLASALRGIKDVELVGEAANGAEAVRLIERVKPDLAFLDLKMPEMDGAGVVRAIRKNRLPLVAFVTAYDQYAVQAFELNAVDYLLKPVDQARVQAAVDRARERLGQRTLRSEAADRVRTAAEQYEVSTSEPLERVPVKGRNEIILVPVRDIASIVAEGELLHIRTTQNERHTITYRLHALESRLRSKDFIRLGRGVVVNLHVIRRIIPLPGGVYSVVLNDNQKFNVSRIQSRIIRDQLLRL
jgi:two-component system LytT family response regulator